MYTINQKVKIEHKRFLEKPELLLGTLIDIRHFQGEDSEGYSYSLNSYHIILDSGKRIILMDKTNHPPYFKTYTLLS